MESRFTNSKSGFLPRNFCCKVVPRVNFEILLQSISLKGDLLREAYAVHSLYFEAKKLSPLSLFCHSVFLLSGKREKKNPEGRANFREKCIARSTLIERSLQSFACSVGRFPMFCPPSPPSFACLVGHKWHFRGLEDILALLFIQEI